MFFCDASFHIFSLLYNQVISQLTVSSFYVTPDVSISQNVNFFFFFQFFFSLLVVVHMHLISLFQWLCHELCNLLLCTSFTAIMSWIQNGHSCPLFCIKCYKQKKKEPFLYFPNAFKEIKTPGFAQVRTSKAQKCGTFMNN